MPIKVTPNNNKNFHLKKKLAESIIYLLQVCGKSIVHCIPAWSFYRFEEVEGKKWGCFRIRIHRCQSFLIIFSERNLFFNLRIKFGVLYCAAVSAVATNHYQVIRVKINKKEKIYQTIVNSN
jgi:hypothetical protein